MTRTWDGIRRFWRDETGQDLVEYALVAVLVALGVAASMRNVAGSVAAVFAKVGTTLTGAT